MCTSRLSNKIEMLGDRTGQRIFDRNHRTVDLATRFTRSNTSSERAQGTICARGNMVSAASWLKEPSSP
jgi:hypothetical protein